MAGYKRIVRRRQRLYRCTGWLAAMGVGVAVFAGMHLAVAAPYGTIMGAFGFAAIALAAHRFMADEGGVAVLTYHSVSPKAEWLPWATEITVAPETFDNHLRTLKAMRCSVIRMADFIAARASGTPLPKRPVILHLDDGYLDNRVAAAPILRRHKLPATLFVSLDFIDPSNDLRPTADDVETGRAKAEDLRWDGYLNWAELRELQDEGLVDVQPHGIDHGRVEISQSVVDEVTPANWRKLAWIQWRATSGPKFEWYKNADPPAVPYGTKVRESAGALAARAWSPEGLEPQAAFEARIVSTLKRSRETLQAMLGSSANVFCWPQNLLCGEGRRIAAELGYAATTGGKGENRSSEDPALLSRLHVNDRALGFRWQWAERLSLRATVRTFQGCYYWHLVAMPMTITRKLVFALRRRLGDAAL